MTFLGNSKVKNMQLMAHTIVLDCVVHLYGCIAMSEVFYLRMLYCGDYMYHLWEMNLIRV